VILSLGYKDKQTFRKQVAYIINKISIVTQSLAKFDREINPSIKMTYFEDSKCIASNLLCSKLFILGTPKDYQVFSFCMLYIFLFF